MLDRNATKVDGESHVPKRIFDNYDEPEPDSKKAKKSEEMKGVFCGYQEVVVDPSL